MIITHGRGLLYLAGLALLMGWVFANPTDSGFLLQAQGGNSTPLTLSGDTPTLRWHGFFGNVSGLIVLNDAFNQSVYSWGNANPEGEIYAVNHSQTPNWADVYCFNMTAGEAEQNITLEELEGSYGMLPQDLDGVNETFNLTFTGSFQIGTSVTINQSSGCRATSQLNMTAFNETLLHDNSSDRIIYATILEPSRPAYDGTPLDFQMIVGDNGDDSVATVYYIYVELS
jgi:hypothetical protein